MTNEDDRIHMKDTNNIGKHQKGKKIQTLPIVCCSHSESDVQRNSTRTRQAALQICSDISCPYTKGEYINGHNHSQENKLRGNVKKKKGPPKAFRLSTKYTLLHYDSKK